MSTQDKNILEFLVALISEFATHLGITQDVAYNYIRKYHGLEYYFKHYNILHTLSFEENVEDLIQVCANHGGLLR
ncbi:MAG: DUF3791 domain-containing protein [Paludibacteraceae bacterium]|nr:DUF3791 domain-containing protein [Paludibacteraceae bacterium]MBR6041814.1 DUF3791 domain-containing protein [Paludibacteraceae bacterium]